MNRFGLNLIGSIMGWGGDGTATAEYAWLELMAATKYDDYSDFRAGSRFVEHLATWLKQFEPADRAVAYDFVKNRLVFISTAEMQRAIEAFVPETVTPHLRRLAAERAGVHPHEVWGSRAGAQAFSSLLRRSLFVGMSDGSRIDILRRANPGRLSQEQVVPMMNVDPDKWKDLGKNLRAAEGSDACFEHVFLIEDFTASGTTFIRTVDGEWKGKLKKFNDLICQAKASLDGNFPIADRYTLHIHHYISTKQARDALDARVKHANTQWTERTYGDIRISQGTLLPGSLRLDPATDAPVLALCNKYYDHSLYIRLKQHCDEAGQSDMKLGYANCALPLILEHNTPNNSIPLLWAETAGEHGPAMTPLFRRRDRHG